MPPRWMWPEHGGARLEAGARLDLALEPLADAAEALVAELVGPALTVSIVPSAAARPRPPPRSRSSARASGGAEISRHTSSMSKGRSGMRITSAPPARPECRAIQPAWRPMTSTTRIRLWLSAVVCRRSMASVATCTAVSKPKVTSVPPRSLSIVFGTPTTGRPCSACSRAAAPSVSSPPIAIRPSRCRPARLSLEPRRPVVALERVGARGAEDRPAAGQDPARGLDRQLVVVVLERPAPAVAEADDGVPVVVDALADDGADDRVEPRAVAAAGEDSDPHTGQSTPRRRANGVGCRASQQEPARRESCVSGWQYWAASSESSPWA